MNDNNDYEEKERNRLEFLGENTMNLNVDKAIPRKLSIVLATIYIMKDIEAKPEIKIICMTVIALMAMGMQWNLDREKKNA